MIDTQTRVGQHLSHFLSNYNYDWFVISAYGSQNYGIVTPQSDVDTYLLTIPNFKDIVFDKKMLSKKLSVNGENCLLKDIRNYFKMVNKQSINFVEIFFSDYYCVNWKYADEWNILKDNAELIGRLNKFRTIKCIGGMAHNQYKKLTITSSSDRLEWLIKYGIDPKALSHLARMYYFLISYIEDKSYKDCLYSPDKNIRQYLLNLKTNLNHYSLNKAWDLADYYSNTIQELVNKYSDIYKDENDPRAKEILDDVLYQIIAKSFRKEIKDV